MVEEVFQEKASEPQMNEDLSQEEALPEPKEVSEEESNLKSPEVFKIKAESAEENIPKSEDLDKSKLEVLMDVELQISVELGRKELPFGEILKLGKGSVIELNKSTEEPVELYVNQSKIALGEVVVVDEHFGVRITKIVDPTERIRKLSWP